MTPRRLIGALGALLLFALFLALLLPTDALVRRLLARGTPPGWPVVAFERAALRPGGIRLEGVTLRTPAGATMLKAGRLQVRPALTSLLRGGSGRPWTIVAEVCGGHCETVVTDDGPATAVTLDCRDVDLAGCPRLRLLGGALEEGRAAGAARVRIAPPAPPEGAGTLALRHALWQGTGRLAVLGDVHADTLDLRWRLGGGRLTLETLALRGPEVSVSGEGGVDLADPLPASALDLALDVTQAPQAPGRIRFLFGLDGDPATPRRLTITGTLGAPAVQMQ